MPHMWNQDRVGLAVTLLSQLLEVAELDDTEMDAVVLLPRLWERSGLELEVFRRMFRASLPCAEQAATDIDAVPVDRLSNRTIPGFGQIGTA